MTVNNSFTFQNKEDMIKKMDEYAQNLSITHNIVNNDFLVTFVCKNKGYCEAILNGVYNEKLKVYHISRINPTHKCSSLEKLTKPLLFELKKEKYKKIRVGLISTEIMTENFKVGYFEIFKIIKDLNISENDIFKLCLKEFESEFLKLNSFFKTFVGDKMILISSLNYSNFFRNVNEIKIYKRKNGFLVFNILYDSNNKSLIESLLVSDQPFDKTISFFIKNHSADFYLIEFDVELISMLNLLNKNFFVKSRSLIGFLDDEDNNMSILQLFNTINYNVCEFINLDIKKYCKKLFNYDLYNLNNKRCVEFDFINDDLLNYDFFDCLNLLLFLISQDIKNNKKSNNYSDNIISEYADTIIKKNKALIESSDDLDNYTVDLEQRKCSCSKFQEFGIPCIHAINLLMKLEKNNKKITNSKENVLNIENTNILKNSNFQKNNKTRSTDPALYVSKYFHRFTIKKITPIVPLINLGPSLYKNLKLKNTCKNHEDNLNK